MRIFFFLHKMHGNANALEICTVHIYQVLYVEIYTEEFQPTVIGCGSRILGLTKRLINNAGKFYCDLFWHNKQGTLYDLQLLSSTHNSYPSFFG